MLVHNALDVIDEGINVYIHDKLTDELLSWYDGKNGIGNDFLCYPVEHITTTDNNGIVLEILFYAVDFDDLTAEQKINAIWDYMYKICPYEHFDDVHSIVELEDCVRKFWRQSEYTLDKYGNWYDEDFCKI